MRSGSVNGIATVASLIAVPCSDYVLPSENKLIKLYRWIGAKSNCCDDPEQTEECQNNELGELKWLLRLSRCDCFQRRYFFKRLHDSDEDVEIESNHSADHVDPTPVAGELPRIACKNGSRKYDQRHDSECNRRGETVER